MTETAYQRIGREQAERRAARIAREKESERIAKGARRAVRKIRAFKSRDERIADHIDGCLSG